MRLSQQQVSALVRQARKKAKEAFDAMKEESMQKAVSDGRMKSESELKNEAIKYRNQLLILPDFILEKLVSRDSDDYDLDVIEDLVKENAMNQIEKEIGEFDFDSKDFENQIWIASIDSPDMEELMKKLPLLKSDNPDNTDSE